MKTLIILTAFLLLSSCESQRAANKTAWLKRNGYMTSDSVIIRDTAITSHYDTTILHDSISEIDTVTINNVQVITKWKTREQRIIQKADTVITERVVPKIIYEQTDCPKRKWYDTFILGFCCGLSLVLVTFGLTFRK